MYRRGEQGSNLLNPKSGLQERECNVHKQSWAGLQGGNSENAAAQTSVGAVLAWESPENFLGQRTCTVAHALTPAGVWASEIKASLHITIWGTVVSLNEEQRYPEDYHVIKISCYDLCCFIMWSKNRESTYPPLISLLRYNFCTYLNQKFVNNNVAF